MKIKYHAVEFKAKWNIPSKTPEEAFAIVEKVIDELTPIMEKYNIKYKKDQTN